MVIGIAGKYSAGKDQVIKFLSASISIIEIDVDAVGHEVLSDKKEAVVCEFGNDIVNGEGDIDRGRLGSMVFSNQKRLNALERIVHPAMREKVQDLITLHPNKNIVINAALLFHMELHRFCDISIWVTAPVVTRLRRAMKRDSLTLSDTLKRFRRQRKLKTQQISKNTDIYTIRNKSSLDVLKNKVDNFIKEKGIR